MWCASIEHLISIDWKMQFIMIILHSWHKNLQSCE